MHCRYSICTTAVWYWLGLGLVLACVPASHAEEKLSFEQHIRPILKTYCLDCHGAGEKVNGKLDLRLRRFAVKGGTSGPAFIEGKPGTSLLIERLKSGEMPPGEKKVPADKIALIERWIATGAQTARQEPDKLPPGIDITPLERAYWFYQPLKPVAVPTVADTSRIRTPVDAFVLAKLREKGLAFNADADRRTLIHRASFDLTGLPPTAEEVERFLADKSERAYEDLIDRLLASPAYGERWGRHWLDVAGYADSEGDGSNDSPRPYAWKYRDYVIRSLNADKPLDRFITEQLAGDELVPQPWNDLKPEQIELLTATGFLRTAPDSTTSGGAPEAQQLVADAIKIVSSTFLGLTVGCAQCHDHRYDPIPQADYYRLRAVFEPAFDPDHMRRPGQRQVSLYTPAERAKATQIQTEASKMQAEYNATQNKLVKAAFDKELTKFPADQCAKLRAAFEAPEAKRTPEQKTLVASNPKLNVNPGVLYQYDSAAAEKLKQMDAKIRAKQALIPPEDFVAVLKEIPGQAPATKIFHRGDYRDPRKEVTPGDLTIAAPDGGRLEIQPKTAGLPTTGRRLALAKHWTSGKHPLVGRVLANRIWLHHFGRGIVDTPGDFGLLGQLPTHPELLDWLALTLAQRQWSMKEMHRLLMKSTVYRQSSQRDVAKDAVDVGNALYGRYAVRRLDGETFRDRILAASGRLKEALYGQPVPTVEDAVGQVSTPDDKPRRSVYLTEKRSKPVAFLSAFDSPTGELNCDRRTSTTTGPQSLMLMNSDFVLSEAAHFARRLMQEAPAAAGVTAAELTDRRIRLAWKIAYERTAEADELTAARAFLNNQQAKLKATKHDPELTSLTDLCQQLLSSNEFLYVD
ncbi:PSD1 and planctomycete cytochrome C domain-containing protein [soil metagenome]